MNIKSIGTTLFVGLLLTTLLISTGCQSGTEPGSTSHASVTVKSASIEEVRLFTADVFGEEGYAPGFGSGSDLVFERQGTRRDALKWGGLAGNGVMMRVKVSISSLAGGNYLLKADAYAVQNSDDDFFRTESRNIMLNHRPYQKMLNEVAKRLKAPKTAS